MTGSITTAITDQGKGDAFFSALHCFNATITFTGNPTNGSANLTSVSALTGLAVGMSLSGTDIPANAVIIGFPTSTEVAMSANATGTTTGVTVTAAGDVFKMALIKFGESGTYSETGPTTYGGWTSGDEATGTGYTAGGVGMTNQTYSNGTPTMYDTFDSNPSWTSATLDVEGCGIYNSTQRGPLVDPVFSYHDFGGQQQVTAGTLTVVMPTNGSSTALYRID